MSRFLTIREVASILGISLSSVWRLIKAGRIRVVHPTPGTTRVSEKELAAYVAFLESRRRAA